MSDKWRKTMDDEKPNDEKPKTFEMDGLTIIDSSGSAPDGEALKQAADRLAREVREMFEDLSEEDRQAQIRKSFEDKVLRRMSEGDEEDSEEGE